MQSVRRNEHLLHRARAEQYVFVLLSVGQNNLFFQFLLQEREHLLLSGDPKLRHPVQHQAATNSRARRFVPQAEVPCLLVFSFCLLPGGSCVARSRD